MTTVEEEQIRVAKAQEEYDKIQVKVRQGYGAKTDLERACKEHGPKGEKAKKLRTEYNRASKELSIAKNDLKMERERALNEKKAALCPTCSRLPDGPLCKACGPANDYKEYESTVEKVEVPAAAVPAPEKRSVMEVMEENAQKAEAKREHTTVVISDKGVSINGSEPLPKEVVSAAIDVVKARREGKQLDLELKPLQLPGGIEETRKISKARVYEDDLFRLKISEDKLVEFYGIGRAKQRTIVTNKLRVLPDQEIAQGDFEEAVERMMDALNIAARQLMSERMSMGRAA